MPVIDVIYESDEVLTQSTPVSNKLTVSKTEKATPGGPFQLSCSVPDHVDIEMCTWRREGVSPMFLQQSGVFDYRRNKIQGLSVLKSDKK